MNAKTALQLTLLGLLAIGTAYGVNPDESDRFRQLEEILPTANSYRTASGAPGHEYWQQQVDYSIEVRLVEGEHRLEGFESIRYHNNSPDTLRYLWLQLDQNRFRSDSHSVLTSMGPDPAQKPSYRGMRSLLAAGEFEGGMRISNVTDAEGQTLAHTINGTMMRVDLAESLVPGGVLNFSLNWQHNINNHELNGGRGGYEHFEEDGNDLFEIAQWFPRLCAYTDVNGWQNKQFMGRGEFTLEFGDYDVSITVPTDHIVAATGVLQNPASTLDGEQRKRLEAARSCAKPIFIVTPEEALAKESVRAEGEQTWTFAAENVRDFAWASSRKFIWDAMATDVGGKQTMAMSFYPKEGEPLWSRYSTHAILHTIDVYSEHTFPYPYPVAISVNGPVGGMEYPMICFNGPRPEDDGTYGERTKYGLISVVIHEVGHNWFPMIVNSDERQWTWMDEGLNTFLQYLAEQAWEEDYPSYRGEPAKIVGYMKSDNQRPIMTNSESILQFGNNGYAKPATALNILRESVMGRELFDFAFKEYANRWQFKRPEPSDLFRSMEDASAVDLDWFWRGWFYTTDHVDIAIDSVTRYSIDTRDPMVEKPLARAEKEEQPTSLAKARNAGMNRRLDVFPELADFYNAYDELDVRLTDRDVFEKLAKDLKPYEKELLESKYLFYAVEMSNLGGLPAPLVLELEYEDGTTEELRIPVEIWARDSNSIRKLLVCDRELARITLDPHLESADVDLSNNVFPQTIPSERMQLQKGGRRGRGGKRGENPMQKAQKAAKQAAEEAAKAAEAAEEAAQPTEAASEASQGEATGS